MMANEHPILIFVEVSYISYIFPYFAFLLFTKKNFWQVKDYIEKGYGRMCVPFYHV